ncbi:hypothetical protein [Lysinibacillus sp. NPDC056232]|uniref:hypothetical protein n=1 Tax=Lysinibacillus sp. NPDC056232 TaxID=3345756 RepID=UPI0035D879BD
MRFVYRLDTALIELNTNITFEVESKYKLFKLLLMEFKDQLIRITFSKMEDEMLSNTCPYLNNAVLFSSPPINQTTGVNPYS